MDSRVKSTAQISETLTNKPPEQTFSDGSNAQIDKVSVDNIKPLQPTFERVETVQADSDSSAVEKNRRGKLLSSGEAAAALGISRSELRRREALGMYVAAHIADNGWHFYDPEYIATLPGYGHTPKEFAGRQTATVKAAINADAFPKRSPLVGGFYNPQEASRIFQALDEGMSSRDIVRTLFIHPDTMKTVYEAWKQLGTLEGGGIQISAKTLAAINELPLPGNYPVTNEAELLSNLREAATDTSLCNKCQKAHGRLCPGCAEVLYRKVEPPPVAKKMGRPRKNP